MVAGPEEGEKTTGYLIKDVDEKDRDGTRRASSVVFVVVSPNETRRVLTMCGVGRGVHHGMDGAAEDHDDYGPGEGSSRGCRRNLGAQAGDDQQIRSPSRGRARTRTPGLCDNVNTPTPNLIPRSTPRRRAGKDKVLSPLAVRRLRRD